MDCMAVCFAAFQWSVDIAAISLVQKFKCFFSQRIPKMASVTLMAINDKPREYHRIWGYSPVANGLGFCWRHWRRCLPYFSLGFQHLQGRPWPRAPAAWAPGSKGPLFRDHRWSKDVLGCHRGGKESNKFNKCFQVWISLGEGYGMVYDIGGAKWYTFKFKHLVVEMLISSVAMFKSWALPIIASCILMCHYV